MVEAAAIAASSYTYHLSPITCRLPPAIGERLRRDPADRCLFRTGEGSTGAVLVDILRAARTAHLDVRVWIRIHDVRGALGARTCGIEDALVTEPTNVDALRRADRFFAADRVPHCATGL